MSDQDAHNPNGPHGGDEQAHGAGHGHGHAGHHRHDDPLHPNVGAEVDERELDPASRSLADALRISFGVLKVVMILLVIAFVFSGTRNVEEGTVAVRTLFGAIQGAPGERVLAPGGPYLWPPEPIGRFITVDTSVQQINIDEAFWFHVPPRQATAPLDQLNAGPLRPGRDGSLLTGDQNIVHGKWTVNYQVRDDGAVRFIRNVSSASRPERMIRQADRVVRAAAERAIVHGVAQAAADDFVRSEVDRGRIRELIQNELDQLGAGIRIQQVLLDQPTPPLATRGAFQAVSRAESAKAKKIEEARDQASKVLNRVAGERHDELLDAIEAYEKARRTNDEEAIAAANEQAQRLLDPANTQGKVSQRISAARDYRRTTEARVRAEAEKFRSLLPQFRKTPAIVLDRLWQSTRQQILGGEVETWYVPSARNKELYLQLPPDPRIERRREAQRFRQQAEQAAQGGQAGEPVTPPSRP